MLKSWIKSSEWADMHVRKRVPLPKLPRLGHMNFILLHYIYMILMAIIGSIILYPIGNMAYIDALFFASGAATQSGLNTIDVNQLYTYQQVVLYFIACITNPIFINTFVVFVRLYWFEKRFQHIAKEVRDLRRTRTRSLAKSESKYDRDLDKEERGVAGRQIVVRRTQSGQAIGHKIDPEEEKGGPLDASVIANGDYVNGSTNGDTLKKTESNTPFPPFHRDIMFADEVKKEEDEDQDRLPVARAKEQHIAFVERQRDPKSTKTLWIPGPRDFDAGYVPEQIDDDEGNNLNRQTSATPEVNRLGANPSHLNMDDHPLKEGGEDEAGPSRGRLARGLAHLPFHRTASTATREPSATGLRGRARSRTLNSFLTTRSQDKEFRDPLPYLSYAATVGRNSTFIDLTEDQRDELGGVEYRSLKTLAVVLICYFVGFHLFGVITLLPWIMCDRHYGDIITNDPVHQSRVWWGIFTPASMFNDLGFTLTPDSMVSFQQATLPLLIGSFLIVIGNTGFPCMLRFCIWITQKFTTFGSPLWEELQFLLDHPRRCFTLLFPSRATWWLFAVLVILNGIDLVLFIILDLHNPTLEGLRPGYRVLDGLFQAFSTRTAGFGVVNLAKLHPGIQVSYLIMMYISIFPIAISVRRTNVYEEKSLGIYGGDDPDAEEEGKEVSYVGAHLRRQLSFDLWYVFLGLFFICVIEGTRIASTTDGDVAFTQFAILFEIISAYGTVGLSLGYPTINASFSAELHTLSKLIIVAMMIRGRHRGLPYALDRAILLPSESLRRKEQEEAARRAGRRNSAMSIAANGGVDGTGKGATGRRMSAATTATAGESRGLGLTRIVTGVLSAGPMHHKHA